MNPLMQGFKALGPARVIGLLVVALAVFGLLATLSLRAGGAGGSLLYADLDLREAAQITEALGRAKIPFQTSPSGTTITVAADDVSRARLLLAKDGLPSGGSIGYEIFDHADGLTATDFQQRINETRALEGEIARSIRGIQGIRAARVHLVLPHREPFAREQQDAQASVLLTMQGGGSLDKAGVQAIMTLVAAAVPGLRAGNIGIVDNRGTLLARAGVATGPDATASTAEELRRGVEARLSRAVEEMLERSLGQGHVRAEAAVTMDYQHVQETEETYDPDKTATRSSQTVNSSNKTTEQKSNVSVANNLPNADAGQTPSGSQESRQEETTNFEIGKTVRTMIREQPQISRVSLAVMVDEVTEPGPDGKLATRPRSAEEMARIASLAKSAIGFDEKRGDHVEVVSMRFVAPDEGAGPPVSAGPLGLERGDIIRLAQTALFGVFAIAALLLVLRPMVAKLSAQGTVVVTNAGGFSLPALAGAASLAGLPSPGQVPGLAGPGGMGAIAGPGGQLALEGPADDDGMVNVAQIDGQMRASALRKLTELAEQNPERTAGIVRAWLGEDAAAAA